MAYEWDFMNEGVKRVREAGRSERAYVLSLNPPELGPLVWQKDKCDFPYDLKDAAEAIAALAESIDPGVGGGSWAALRTIVDLADWIKDAADAEE